MVMGGEGRVMVMGGEGERLWEGRVMGEEGDGYGRGG